MTDPWTDFPPEAVAEIERLVKEARKHPPKFDRVAPPLDVADVKAKCTGGLYEGFEEDVKRMRRGLPALGPRE